MKKITAGLIFAGIIILPLVLVHHCAGQTVALNGNTDPVSVVDAVHGERSIIIKGKIAGDFKTWLTIEAYNGQYWKTDGYDPSYVRIVSSYKPLFRHLPNGDWEIRFVSELTEKGSGIP